MRLSQVVFVSGSNRINATTIEAGGGKYGNLPSIIQIYLTLQIPGAKKGPRQVCGGMSLLRSRKIEVVSRLIMKRRDCLQRHQQLRDRVQPVLDRAAGYAEVGNNVRGEDFGQQLESVLVDGNGEEVQGLLDFNHVQGLLGCQGHSGRYGCYGMSHVRHECECEYEPCEGRHGIGWSPYR